MRKIMVSVWLVVVGLSMVVPVSAAGRQPFDPAKEVATVKWLTTASEWRWFQVSAWCEAGEGCWKADRVGARPVSVDDGQVKCFMERKPRLLRKGSCYFVLLDPMSSKIFFVMAQGNRLDRRLFTVQLEPEPEPDPVTPTPPSPTPTPDSSVFMKDW